MLSYRFFMYFVYFLLPTDKNPDVFEKYFAFVSFERSAACGLTISKPCNGVNATLDAVPDICLRTVVLPP